MKLNEPLTPEQHEQADKDHHDLALSKRSFLREIAGLIAAGEPLSSLQRKWAAGAVCAFADSIPTERPRPAGKKPKVPEEALLLRAVYIKKGMRPTDVDNELARIYGVELETLKSRLRRLRAAEIIDLSEWGLKS